MTEEQPKPKKPKRIKLSDSSFMMALGGKKESKDYKMVFIDKTTQQHYTYRIIQESQDILSLDFHLTNQNDNAHKPLFKVSFDLKLLQGVSQEWAQKTLLGLSKTLIPIESDDMFKGKTLTPLFDSYKANPTITQSKDGENVVIDQTAMQKLIEEIHGVADLERLGYKAAIVGENNKMKLAAVFLKDGKWYYFDALTFFKQVLLALEPAIVSIEGTTKEDFVGFLNSRDYS